MFGQPVGFAVGKVIPTEPIGATAPAVVVQLNDSITLKTYLHVDASVQGILRTAIKNALASAGAKVEYHLQDLETGAMVPTIAGGAITKLPAGDIAIAFGTSPGPAATPGVVEGELRDSGLPSTGDYYLSADTATVTTGDSASTATLKLATATSVSGSWRILTHAHGGAGSEVSAFDDDLLITVIS
jgi:hypothetical protein